MSTTPAQVTKAHRTLAPIVAYACYGGKFCDDKTDEQQIPEPCLVAAAQLIADSEAKSAAVIKAKLAAERARLDWLENRGWLEKTCDGWLCGEMTRVGVSNKSVRAAIDAAMKESAP
jgi:hypothetical protein